MTSITSPVPEQVLRTRRLVQAKVAAERADADAAQAMNDAAAARGRYAALLLAAHPAPSARSDQ